MSTPALLARALPALLLLLAAPLVARRVSRRWGALLEGEGGRIAVLGAMTFAVAGALEIAIGRGLHAVLELTRAPSDAGAALLVGLAVALAHEPLRFVTYRHFLSERRGADRRGRASATLFGLGYGAAMAGLAALVLLTGIALEALGGEGMRALGFGEGLARRADLRAAFAGVEPWRPWLAAADQLAWVAFQVGVTLLVARGRLARLALAFVLHGLAAGAVLLAAEESLQLETAAHGAAGFLGLALAFGAWRRLVQGDSERSSVT